MFRSQSLEKFRYDTTKGQPENTSVQPAQFQDPDACLLRLQASVSPQQHEPSCAVLQVPAFWYLNIGYPALHCGAIGEGQAWIKAFSPSKGIFFPEDGEREGCSGVPALLPTAPQATAHSAAVWALN